MGFNTKMDPDLHQEDNNVGALQCSGHHYLSRADVVKNTVSLN